jgi:hypothetical protein
MHETPVMALPPLKFICPVSGKEADTGVELDEDTFARLNDETELSCPHCSETHRLCEVLSWLGDEHPEVE